MAVDQADRCIHRQGDEVFTCPLVGCQTQRILPTKGTQGHVNLCRAAGLQDAPIMQHQQAVRDIEGFLLVMRDIDGRISTSEAANAAQPSMLSQRPVQRSQWLIQHQAGLRSQRTRQSHPLLLAPRKIRHSAIANFSMRTIESERLTTRSISPPAMPRDVQPKGNVFLHGQVRKRRVILKHQ